MTSSDALNSITKWKPCYLIYKLGNRFLWHSSTTNKVLFQMRSYNLT